MIPGRLFPRCGGVALLVVAGLAAGGCRPVDGVPTPGVGSRVPDSPADLEPLVVSEVPSGMPRLPDEELDPPAGAKRVEDIARYAEDPVRERDVLEDYGYRHGWERFWGHADGGPVTGVFVDQFGSRAGAGAYAEDRARNDAEHYEGILSENPPHLPGGCREVVVEHPQPEDHLDGPLVTAWCVHGSFSVSVSAVGESVEAAADEVRGVMADQLALLPPR